MRLKELGVERDALNRHGHCVPFLIDDEMRELYRRADCDVASLDAVQRNRVLGRMPPEDEEVLSWQRLNCSREQLFEKSRCRSRELTMLECDMIVLGFDYDWKKTPPRILTDFERMGQLSKEDRHLVLDARHSVEVSWIDFRLAKEKKKEYDYQKSLKAQQRKEAARAARAAPRAEWLQTIMDQNLPIWGFIIIRSAYGDRTLELAWTAFQEHYNEMCKRVMNYWERDKNVALWRTHKSLFVSDDSLGGATKEDLIRKYNTSKSGIADGIQTDCFLIADEVVLAHRSVLQGAQGASPYPPERTVAVKVVDPSYVSSSAPATEYYGYESAQSSITASDLEGYDGVIKVPLAKVFDWLYFSLLFGTESWSRRYKQTTQQQPRARLPYTPYPSY